MEEIPNVTLSRESSLEKKMRRLGSERALRGFTRAAASSTLSTVGGGHALLADVVMPLAKGITEYLAEVQGGGASTRTTAAPLLCQVEALTAAYLTASTVINRLAEETKLSSTAHALGAAMEDEVRFSAFRANSPALFAVLHKTFLAHHSQSEAYRRRVLVHYARLNKLEWSAWTARSRTTLGLKLIELLIQTTGIVETTLKTVSHGKKGVRSVALIQPTQAALDVIHHVQAQLGARPHYLPTVVEPRPWTTPARGSGGYYYLQQPLVSEHNRAHQEELAATEMPVVLRAVNALQETPWRVNRDVLAVVLAIWNSDHDVEHVDPETGAVHAPLRPRAVLEELPPRAPADTLISPEELREVKARRRAIHERNLVRRRHAVSASLTVSTAMEFSEYDAFFFPQFLDFRGRCYPRPAQYTPQGDDLAKGLLTFADALPLGASGVEWLAIHGANSWGIDKVPLEERVQWTSDHSDDIQSFAADPLGSRGWMAADAPFVFLAFCFEWSRMLQTPDPEEYASSLPVAVDGSCNGLQHFSAMLRDEVGGAAVNLVPDARPHDVYGEVLAAVKEKLRSIVPNAEDGSSSSSSGMAQAWIDSGLLVRDLVKRPTMTLPYGCTRKGVEAMIFEDTLRPSGHKFEGDASGWKHVIFLGGVIWEAMGEVVVAARRAMTWLQTAADLVADTNQPMVWYTPVGFPVRHFVRLQKQVVVSTAIGGRRLQITLHEDTETVDKRRMRLGVAPNFVHSLDATHLYMTVCAALDAGITAFAMVHDSYGTHAAHVARLGEVLRASFVELYSAHDPLAELAAELAARGIEVPPMPPRGSLELDRVRESAFFFA